MSETSRRLIALLSFFLLLSLNGWPQGAKIRVEQDADATNRDRQSEMDNVRAREQWFRANRTIPGERSAELLHRAYQQKQQLQAMQQLLGSSSSTTLGKGAQSSNPMPLSSPGLTTFGAAWTSLGPSPMISDTTGAQDYGKVDGRLTSVAVDQGSGGSTVYIGAAFGGLWRSDNATVPADSVTWTQLLDQQPTLAVGAIAIQPGTTGNSAVVLIGTGEPNSSADSYYGMGILRSIDGGATWTNPNDTSTPLIKGADSDFPEPGQNPEHTGEPEEKAMNSDEKDMKNRPKQERDNSEKVDQDPGERQKENQNQQKDDPLAA